MFGLRFSQLVIILPLIAIPLGISIAIDKRNKRTRGQKALTLFANYWFFQMFLLIIIFLVLVYIKTGSFMEAMLRAQDRFNLFIVIFPGFFALGLRKSLEQRQKTTNQ